MKQALVIIYKIYTKKNFYQKEFLNKKDKLELKNLFKKKL